MASTGNKSSDSISLRQTLPADEMSNAAASLSSTYSRAINFHTAMKLDSPFRDGPPQLDPDEGVPPNHDNCDHDDQIPSISISSTSKMAGQTVAPFLARHIPKQYAPLGSQRSTSDDSQKDPNTKFCYRHRPDVKCRRTADEPSMDNLQRVR